MTTSEPIATVHLEAGLHLGGVLLRAVAYALVATFAGHYDCGRSVLMGMFFGDALASLVGAVWRWHEDRWHFLGELLVLLLVYLWMRAELVWPSDAAQQAIATLSAMGVFCSRAGLTALTRLGPQENGFA